MLITKKKRSLIKSAREPEHSVRLALESSSPFSSFPLLKSSAADGIQVSVINTHSTVIAVLALFSRRRWYHIGRLATLPQSICGETRENGGVGGKCYLTDLTILPTSWRARQHCHGQFQPDVAAWSENPGGQGTIWWRGHWCLWPVPSIGAERGLWREWRSGPASNILAPEWPIWWRALPFPRLHNGSLPGWASDWCTRPGALPLLSPGRELHPGLCRKRPSEGWRGSRSPGHGVAGSPHSYRVPQKKSVAFQAPSQRDQGLGWHFQPKPTREKVDLRTVILSRKASAKRSWHTFTKCSFQTPGHLHTELHQRLADLSPVRTDGGSALRCHPCPYERAGVKAQCQEECGFSSTEDYLSWHGVGFDDNAGTSVSCSYWFDSCSREQCQARPVTHCEAVSGTVVSCGSSIRRDTFWPAVHEIPAVVAQDQGVFPEGQPISLGQGHVVMPTCLSHEERSLGSCPRVLCWELLVIV